MLYDAAQATLPRFGAVRNVSNGCVTADVSVDDTTPEKRPRNGIVHGGWGAVCIYNIDFV